MSIEFEGDDLATAYKYDHSVVRQYGDAPDYVDGFVDPIEERDADTKQANAEEFVDVDAVEVANAEQMTFGEDKK